MAFTHRSRATEGLSTTGADVVVKTAVPPSAGQVLTATGASAANWQTPAGGGGGGFTAIRAHAYSSANALFLGDGVAGDLPFDVALFDTAGMFNPGVPNRLTVQAGGAGGWTVKGNTLWPTGGLAGYRRLQIRQFSSLDVLKGTGISEIAPADSPANWNHPAIGIFECVVGDYFTMEWFQNSGGALFTIFGGTPYEVYMTAVFNG